MLLRTRTPSRFTLLATVSVGMSTGPVRTSDGRESDISPVIKTDDLSPLKSQSLDYVNTQRPKNKGAHCLLRRVHILSWIRTYDRKKAFADLIAGITLGMTIIPQSIAYANLAGLSSEYGLYSSFVGSFVYVIFGTIPQVSIGPTSLMAILTLQFTMDLPPQFVIVLAFLSGVAEFAMGIFNLGFMVNFISQPVTSAFTTGTSLIVILAQIGGLFGVKKGKTDGLRMLNIFKEISIGDTTLGLSCVIVLLCLRKLGNVAISGEGKYKRGLKSLLWYISISRNAIVVLCSSAIAFKWTMMHGRSGVPFALSMRVNSTSPKFQLPPFAISWENSTYFFPEIFKELGSGVFVVPIVAVLANVAIANAFAKDKLLDASQEMFTLGICNIAGSFFNAMPTCGAFTRSAVSEASGVKTPFSGIYTGVLVLLALGILTPYFEFIPRSTLSAVLIVSVIFMVDFTVINEFWAKSKRDFINWFVVLIVCLFGGVELGLFSGILINMIVIISRIANPRIKIMPKHDNGRDFLHVVSCNDIYYVGAIQLRNKIKEKCFEYNYELPVVIDCTKLTQHDFSITYTLKAIIKDLEEKNVPVYLEVSNFDSDHHFKEFETKVITSSTEISSFAIPLKA